MSVIAKPRGSSPVTADNGLHIDPTNNVRLGGTFMEDVNLDHAGYGMMFTNQGWFWMHTTGMNTGDQYSTLYYDNTQYNMSFRRDGIFNGELSLLPYAAIVKWDTVTNGGRIQFDADGIKLTTVHTFPTGTNVDMILVRDTTTGLVKQVAFDDVVDSGDFIWNQNATTQTANFIISGTGIANTLQNDTHNFNGLSEWVNAGNGNWQWRTNRPGDGTTYLELGRVNDGYGAFVQHMSYLRNGNTGFNGNLSIYTTGVSGSLSIGSTWLATTNDIVISGGNGYGGIAVTGQFQATRAGSPSYAVTTANQFVVGMWSDNPLITAQKFQVFGDMYLSTIANETVDPDKILVDSSGVIKYMTKAQLGISDPGDFIWNQNSSAQTANYWISGTATSAYLNVTGDGLGQTNVAADIQLGAFRVNDGMFVLRRTDVTYNSINFRNASGATAALEILHNGSIRYYSNAANKYFFEFDSAGSYWVESLNDGTGVPKMVTTTNGLLGYQAIPAALNAGDFIWNQNSSAQTANYWINGNGRVDGNFLALGNITNNGSLYSGWNGSIYTVSIGGYQTYKVDVTGAARVSGNFHAGNPDANWISFGYSPTAHNISIAVNPQTGDNRIYKINGVGDAHLALYLVNGGGVGIGKDMYLDNHMPEYGFAKYQFGTGGVWVADTLKVGALLSDSYTLDVNGTGRFVVPHVGGVKIHSSGNAPFLQWSSGGAGSADFRITAGYQGNELEFYKGNGSADNSSDYYATKLVTMGGSSYTLDIKGSLGLSSYIYSYANTALDIYVKNGSGTSKTFDIRDNFTGGSLMHIYGNRTLAGLSAITIKDFDNYTHSSNSTPLWIEVRERNGLFPTTVDQTYTNAISYLGANHPSYGGTYTMAGLTTGVSWDNGNGAWMQAINFIGSGFGGAPLFINPFNGKVIIGTSADMGNYKLQVNGIGRFNSISSGQHIQIGALEANFNYIYFNAPYTSYISSTGAVGGIYNNSFTIGTEAPQINFSYTGSGPFIMGYFQIEDGTLNLNYVPNATVDPDKIMVLDNGKVKHMTKAQLGIGGGGGGTTYTFSNGITDTSGAVKLGGPLIENTVLSGAYNLAVTDGRLAVGASSYTFAKIYGLAGPGVSGTGVQGVKSTDPNGTETGVGTAGQRVISVTTFSNNSVQSGVYGEIGFNNTSGFTFSGSTITNLSGLVGVFTQYASSGNLSSGSSIFSGGAYYAHLGGTGNVDKIAAVRIQRAMNTPGLASYSGTLTTYYGLHIDDLGASTLAAQITNKYAIYQLGVNDLNHFKGKMDIVNDVEITGAGRGLILTDTSNGNRYRFQSVAGVPTLTLIP